ncbi:hypothetical protein LTR62_002133 [Meristemomyces frigidus]|uniref:Uncharacterized protein n=1 Tax=Meristemomyces frigidus TaxID=1508187 RepID=A0AAN7T8R4_9PEZI|nr:hypothetical protein LTR62_002133 [Meristemomyces frigidus]
MAQLQALGNEVAKCTMGSPEYQTKYRQFDHDHRRLYCNSNSAQQIFPDIGYDQVFIALHSKVREIDPESAAPIAMMIYLKDSTQTLLPMLDFPPVDGPPQPFDSEPPVCRNERLIARIAAARGKWSEKLAQNGFVDVDITFKMTTKMDIALLKQTTADLVCMGAKLYHMWDFTEWALAATISMVVKRHVLEYELPPRVQREVGISIKLNTPAGLTSANAPFITAVASPYTKQLPKPETVQCLEPDLHAEQEQGPYDLHNPVKKAADFTADSPSNQQKPDPCEAIVKAIEARPRSETLERFREVAKTKNQQIWNIYPSTSTVDKPLRPWTKENEPFRNTPPILGDDQWWVGDHVVREALIAKWERDTLQEELGSWPTRYVRNSSITNRDPEVAAANKDFRLVPGLSSTYTADRNFDWWADNVERAMMQEAREAYEVAERFADNVALRAEDFWRRYCQVQVAARLGAAHACLDAAMTRLYKEESDMAGLVTKAEQHLVNAADACHLRLHRDRFNVMERLREKAREDIAKACGGRQQRPLSTPRYPIQVPSAKLARSPIPADVVEAPQATKSALSRRASTEITRRKLTANTDSAIASGSKAPADIPLVTAAPPVIQNWEPKPKKQHRRGSKATRRRTSGCQKATPLETIQEVDVDDGAITSDSEAIASSVDTMPFPPYVDPMSEMIDALSDISTLYGSHSPSNFSASPPEPTTPEPCTQSLPDGPPIPMILRPARARAFTSLALMSVPKNTRNLTQLCVAEATPVDSVRGSGGKKVQFGLAQNTMATYMPDSPPRSLILHEVGLTPKTRDSHSNTPPTSSLKIMKKALKVAEIDQQD